ncbi:MAG: O-antigen ligase family protein [Propylenella sp.]
MLNGLSFLPAWWASGVVLLLALMLGGGTRQGLLSDAVVQLASLPLLGTALFQVAKSEMNGQRRAALWLLAAVALLPILQLLPMPPAIWPLLPGRSAFASAYAEAAMPVPWLGISLSPPATWRSALALVPPVAIFLSVLMLGRRARRALTIGLIAFGFVSVLLGLAQVAQGPESGLRFYAVTNLTESVGFFANRNHFAALLYFVLPFTAAWAVGLAADRRPEMLVGVSLCLLVFASLLLGLGVSRSRGGLALAMLGGAGSLALAWTGQGALATKRASRFVFVGGLVGAFLILQFASLGILQRLETDIADDLRWELTSVTAGIAIKFQPFGSGIGTFDPIYRMFEEAERLRAVYANHAHNDYVELLLEGGLPAIILILAFFGWLAHASVQVWRRPSSGHDSAIDVSLPRAATIAALLICIHSAVDYPLRTTTLSTLFAFACALAIPPIRGRSGNGSGETRDSGRSSSHRRRRSTSRPVAAGAEPRASLRGAPD